MGFWSDSLGPAKSAINMALTADGTGKDGTGRAKTRQCRGCATCGAF